MECVKRQVADGQHRRGTRRNTADFLKRQRRRQITGAKAAMLFGIRYAQKPHIRHHFEEIFRKAFCFLNLLDAGEHIFLSKFPGG
jgi:hypothetical protein